MDGTRTYTTMRTPVGGLLLTGTGTALAGVWFTPHRGGAVDPTRDPTLRPDDGRLDAAVEQLGEYFAGRRDAFELELAVGGTPFQRRVWAALAEIPYGTTISYATLARRVGSPDAVRAVGLANGRNPISIVVPCHRVIGSDGSLTGYGGGLERKRRLLDLEAGVLDRPTLV